MHVDALAPVSITGIATAIATVLTAIGGVILSVTVLIPLLHETRHVKQTTEDVKVTTEDTKHLVNQQRTDMVNYQRALVRTLKSHGIEVPTDQSAPNGDAGETDAG
jgi:hypothetical protein